MNPSSTDPILKKHWPYRPVMDSGMESPWLWLGTWSMGGEGFGKSDAHEAEAVLNRAFEQGVRHFDTAGLYAHGRSEELLARALAKKRPNVFLSSKGGLVWHGNQVKHRATREDLSVQLQASLKRLRTDYLDLYQLHWPDPAVPIEESLDALADFQKRGLVRHWGVGNFDSSRVARFLPEGAFVPHQFHFNPIHQNREVLAAGKTGQRCCGCAYSPLEQGLLGDSPGGFGVRKFGSRDLRNRNRYFSSQQVGRWLLELDGLARETAMSRVTLTLLWILASGLEAVIPGPRTLVQLEKTLEHRAWISRLGPEWPVKLRQYVGPELWEHLEKGPGIVQRESADEKIGDDRL